MAGYKVIFTFTFYPILHGNVVLLLIGAGCRELTISQAVPPHTNGSQYLSNPEE
jgi:hypothetical protein